MPLSKKRGSKALALVAEQYGARSSIHGLAYVSDSLLPSQDRILWLLLFIGCLSLALFLNISSYAEWQENQVVTNVKERGRPVAEVPFPTVTVCGMGLHLTNVEERLLEDFDMWRKENKRTKEENIDDDMADYMTDVFQIQDRETSILDILNTMISPNVDAALAANGVRENAIACKRKEEVGEGATKRKREIDEDIEIAWKHEQEVNVADDNLIGTIPAFGETFNITFELNPIEFNKTTSDEDRRYFFSMTSAVSNDIVLALELRQTKVGRIWTHFNIDELPAGGERKYFGFNREGKEIIRLSEWNRFNVWTEKNSGEGFTFVVKINDDAALPYYNENFTSEVLPDDYVDEVKIYAGPGKGHTDFCAGKIRNVAINTIKPQQLSILSNVGNSDNNGLNVLQGTDGYHPTSLLQKIVKKSCISSPNNHSANQDDGNHNKNLPSVDIFVNPNKTEDLELIVNVTKERAKFFFRCKHIL